MHAVRLTADLQRSRERLVTAREEERRRLRRDLHDGLGPTLAGLGAAAGRRAPGRSPSDPDAAQELLGELRSEPQAAIADVRRLVYELRPPALDELGLVGGAARAGRRRLGSRAAARWWPSTSAPAPCRTLPAAVEVAAYRIARRR